MANNLASPLGVRFGSGLALVRDRQAPPEQLTREVSFEVRAGSANDANRTVQLTFSSEEPYARWWGVEVLDHASGSVRLGRLNNGGALLMDHDSRDQVGAVVQAINAQADFWRADAALQATMLGKPMMVSVSSAAASAGGGDDGSH